MDIIAALSALGGLLGGAGQLLGSQRQSGWKPFDPNAYYEQWNNLRDILQGVTGNQVPKALDIFAGTTGQTLMNQINDMLSGKSATSMTSLIQRQLAPSLAMSLDKLSASINPSLRGTGLQAKMMNDMTSSYYGSLADALAKMRYESMTAGTDLLAKLRSQQTEMNLMQLLNALQGLGSLAGR